MELSQQQQITALLDAGPSSSSWRAIYELLSPLSDTALQETLSMVRESVLRWPANIRRAHLYDDTKAWLKPLFDGKIDPRLELVGWASVSHSFDTQEDESTFSYKTLAPIAKAFACYVDPSFDYPDVLLHKDYDFTSASGCGGGYNKETRGDEKRGMRWYDSLTEHAADYSSDGSWSPYGLAGGCELHIGRHERGSVSPSFSAEGPAPMVLELAYAWGLLWRSGSLTLDNATAALEETRKVWRSVT